LKLSIITINKNNAAGLEKTIQSVVCQTYSDFEYIVIDGASVDGSLEIIKKYADKINYWVSETDTGIYNAMNKGIRQAIGEYCLFLNSGDYLIENNSLKYIFSIITGDADIYYCDCLYAMIPKTLNVNKLIQSPISHQNSIIKRHLFIEHGYYNEEFIISSDYEFFLKEIWKFKTNFRHIPMTLSFYEGHGISATNISLREKERKLVFSNVFNEISDSIIEYFYFNKTIYADIIRKCGNSLILNFILRAYRFIAKRLFRKKDYLELWEHFE